MAAVDTARAGTSSITDFSYNNIGVVSANARLEKAAAHSPRNFRARRYQKKTPSNEKQRTVRRALSTEGPKIPKNIAWQI